MASQHQLARLLFGVVMSMSLRLVFIVPRARRSDGDTGHHLAQLACYAAALQRMGCAVAKVGLVLGNQAPGASAGRPRRESVKDEGPFLPQKEGGEREVPGGKHIFS